MGTRSRGLLPRPCRGHRRNELTTPFEQGVVTVTAYLSARAGLRCPAATDLRLLPAGRMPGTAA